MALPPPLEEEAQGAIGVWEGGREGTHPGVVLPSSWGCHWLSSGPNILQSSSDKLYSKVLLNHVWTTYFGDRAEEKLFPTKKQCCLTSNEGRSSAEVETALSLERAGLGSSEFGHANPILLLLQEK